MMNQTRVTLLRKVSESKAGAWDEFYAIYAPMLVRFATSLGVSRSDADEVRDACLASLVDRMPGFSYDRSRGTFRSFLYQMVRGQVIDLFRRRRIRWIPEDEWRQIEDDGPGPAERWDRIWLHEHLLHALRTVSVPPLSAHAFRMLLLEGMSVDEVCERLGLNRNQVYKAKSLVLGKVRERLRTLGIDP